MWPRLQSLSSAPIGRAEGQLPQQGRTCCSAHFKIKMAASVCRCYGVRQSYMSFIAALESPADNLVNRIVTHGSVICIFTSSFVDFVVVVFLLS